MGRRLRTPLPQHPFLLTPDLPNGAVIAVKERQRRLKDSSVYNKRHHVRTLSALTRTVWITSAVLSTHSTPHSY
ncbi:hypothetical protein LDENG_00187330 [Lucifuga dentata]|nr:hypothetical protein LDENG_00187330 [Lucifuga dentata]